MRRSVALTVALLLVLPAIPAHAQRGRGPGGGGGGGRHREIEPLAPVGDGRYPITFPEVLEVVNRGEGRAALAWYEGVAAEAEKKGDAETLARVQSAIAFVAPRVGRLQLAVSSASRALDYYRAHPPAHPQLVHNEVSLYATLANAYRAIGDTARSRQAAEDGLAFAQAHRSVPGVPLQVAGMSNQLASTLRQQGDVRGSLERSREAVDAAEAVLAALRPSGRERLHRAAARHIATGLTNEARALRLLNQPEEAEAMLTRAAAEAQRLGLPALQAEVLATRAQLAEQRGDYAAAGAAYESAIAQVQAIGGQPFLVMLHAGAARTLGHLNRVDEALEHARQATGLVEDIRAELQASDLRSDFVEDKQGLYITAAHLALRAKRPDEAFAFSERGRARALLDLLGNQTTLSKGATKALVAEEVRLRANLAEAKARAADPEEDAAASKPLVDAAEREYREFLERVRKTNGEQASLMAVEPVSAAEVQALLAERTTLVEYLVGGDSTLAWTIDRAHVRARRLPVGRADLVTEVRALRTAITEQQPLADVQARARALYDRLLAPVRGWITTERVIVVPHDVLHYLPFAALRTPADRWLVEDMAIATLPSASVLKYLGDKERGTAQGVVAIGNPDLGAGLQLGWAEREARFIGGRYPAATVLVRDDATKKRALTAGAGAGVLHFATHGELNEQNPLDSALLLTPADGNDGRLAVRDIFGLDLHARLVVLSACETGLGKLSRGDDLVGLQRAFLYAGTPAVVTTLWKVDDRASYELVRAFYDRLATAPAVEALRQAQLATLQTFPHPFQWAAFTLTGVTP